MIRWHIALLSFIPLIHIVNWVHNNNFACNAYQTPHMCIDRAIRETSLLWEWMKFCVIITLFSSTLCHYVSMIERLGKLFLSIHWISFMISIQFWNLKIFQHCWLLTHFGLLMNSKFRIIFGISRTLQTQLTLSICMQKVLYDRQKAFTQILMIMILNWIFNVHRCWDFWEVAC